MSERILRGDHCQCRTCGAWFNSTRAFDKHRKGPYGNRRCLSADEMAAIGMALNAGGWWVTAALKMAPAYLYRDSGSGDLAQAVTGADGEPRAVPVIISARDTPCS